jgi:hypothetical protein
MQSSSKKVVAAFGREQNSLITWYPYNFVKCVQGQLENSLSCVNYHMICENGSLFENHQKTIVSGILRNLLSFTEKNKLNATKTRN